MTKRKRGWFMLAAVALAVTAVVVWRQTRALSVEVVQVSTREVVEVYVVTGQVRAPREASLGLESSGRVQALRVRAGDRPESGQVLLELQPEDAQLALKRAQAQVEVAQAEYDKVKDGPTPAARRAARARVQRAQVELDGAQRELARVRELTSKGVGTQAALDSAQLAWERAQSDLRLAQAQLQEQVQPASADLDRARGRLEEARANLEAVGRGLGQATLEAPFEGVVLSVEVAPGEVVQAGQAALRMAPLADLEIYAEVNEEYYGRLREGMEATCSFAGLAGQRVQAQVRQVGPEVDGERGVVGLHLEPRELPARVLPGLTVDVAVELRRVPGARAVPRRAVLRPRGQRPSVFVVADGRASQRPITVEVEGESFFGVQGLPEGAVLVADATLVEDGQAVQPREAP